LVTKLKAITFDLWDTIVHDDSDEPKRKAKGLRTKKEERRHLLWDALNRVEPIPFERVKLAYDVGDAAFNKVWHDQHVTWTIGERLQVILKGLGRKLGDADLDRVVKAHEEMEVEIRPDLIPGITEALAARPVQAALASAGTFAVGAVLPLLLVPLLPDAARIAGIGGGSLLALALLGFLAARAGGAPPAIAVARVTFWGALAMGLTAGVGALFGVSA